MRKQALERFGSDLLVTSTERHRHVNCNAASGCSSSDLAIAEQSAASDMLLMAETDYQVRQTYKRTHTRRHPSTMWGLKHRHGHEATPQFNHPRTRTRTRTSTGHILQ